MTENQVIIMLCCFMAGQLAAIGILIVWYGRKQ